MAAHHERGERSYVGKRHKLIPIAERLTREQFKGVKNSSGTARSIAFHRHMTVLAIEAGLMNPGNLVVFDAKELPRGTFNQATGKMGMSWD